MMFQFTHPCGCDFDVNELTQKQKRFNSRTRVGATTYDAKEINQYLVSIHAPVWVRPYVRTESRTVYEVSIHAPVWVRPYTTVTAAGETGFNSRTRVGATLKINRICF